MGKNKGIKERDMFVLKRFPKVSLVELRNEENVQNYPKKEAGQTYAEIKIKMSPGR